MVSIKSFGLLIILPPIAESRPATLGDDVVLCYFHDTPIKSVRFIASKYMN